MTDTSALRERRKEASDSPFADLDDTSSPSLTKTTTRIPTPPLPASKPTRKSANDYATDEDNSGISLLDVLRSLVFILVVSCGLSYVITRESYVWGMKRPGWTKPEVLKAYWNGPLHLTDADLPRYSGESGPETPIYLAINGSIYDVSAGRRHYGPGGSYHFFAGVDASRAFVTQCFEEDRTPDMRGVEEMFLPVDDEVVDAEIEALIGKGGMKKLKEKEKREARKSVEAALGHWTGFFGSGKYPKVGEVKREKGWETKGPKPALCDKAQKGRKKRAIPTGGI